MVDATMSIDIYHSRRTNYRACKYWLPSDEKNRDVVVLKETPAGIFYAEEVNVITSGFNPVANVFASNKNTITLKTNDDVKDIKKMSIVLYLGKSWTVDDVQREMHKKETQFDNDIHATTYINLRR